MPLRLIHLSLPEEECRWSSYSPMCSYCLDSVESILHVLRDREYAISIWKLFMHLKHMNKFLILPLRHWITINLERNLGTEGEEDWSLLWGYAVWKLWHWRNEANFDANFVKPMNPASIIKHSWRSFIYSSDSRIPKAHVQTVVSINSWSPPPQGWFKINVDGVMSKSTRKAACGWVIRDHTGQWIVGFALELGSCSVLKDETWATFKRLKLAWDCGFKNVMLESDDKGLVEYFAANKTNKYCSLLTLHVHELLNDPWETKLRHIGRNANQVADALTKRGLSGSSYFDACPMEVRNLLEKDLLGYYPT